MAPGYVPFRPNLFKTRQRPSDNLFVHVPLNAFRTSVRDARAAESDDVPRPRMNTMRSSSATVNVRRIRMASGTASHRMTSEVES